MPDLPVTAIDRIPEAGRRAFVIALRLGLALVFLSAALPKLADPGSFAADIDHYHLLPGPAVGLFAVAVPATELVVAAALASGVHARGAAIVAALMLAIFAAAMGQAMARGIDLDCGCFGGAAPVRVSTTTLARNVALALACLPVALAARSGPLSRPATGA